MKRTVFLSLLIIATLASCSKDDITANPVNPPSKNYKAKPIYNQAYQENFEADKIEDIIKEAKNAYVLIDPFQDGVIDKITTIKANGNEVGGYISIGTGEDWRPDYNELKPYLVSVAWGQWAGEYFVNETTTGILPIMKARIDKMADWGCDWVEFDNMDWAFDDNYRTEYGFKVTKAEAITFYQALCDYVHQKGMKCMAKNTVQEASDFDGVLYESYTTNKNWWDTKGTQSFLEAQKLVIINHYNESECDKIYDEYKKIYTADISYICEDVTLKKYKHYNQ